jgi:hypothetical protein
MSQYFLEKSVVFIDRFWSSFLKCSQKMLNSTLNVISRIHDIIFGSVWDNMKIVDNIRNNISHLKGIDVVFQNDLVCGVSFEGAASCYFHWLVVCYAVMYYRCYFYNIFDLLRSFSAGQFCVIAALYCFLDHCCETRLKLVLNIFCWILLKSV